MTNGIHLSSAARLSEKTRPPHLLEQNDEWAVSRRYMTLESIAQTSDNLTLKLPTVAA